MRPVLFYLGSYPVASHDFFMLLGVVAAVVVFFYEAQRRNMLYEEVIWVALGSLFGGAVGARLSGVWAYVEAAPEPSLQGLLLHGGKSILGGLAGAYLGAVLTKRVVGFREHTGDLFAPAVALGMAIGRWGCFLSEQIGTPTSLPWGIRLSAEAAARIPPCEGCVPGARLHPSFLYEILFHLLCFGWLLWLRPRVRASGELLKIYLLSYAIFRFGVEFVRGNPVAWAGLSYSQIFLVPSTIALAWYFRRSRRRGAALSRERAARLGA